MITFLNEDLAYRESTKYNIYGGDGECDQYTDNPNEAVELWFKAQERFSMDVAILTYSKNNANELYATVTEDFIEAMDKKYRSPYKIDYLLNWFRRAKDKGSTGYFSDGIPDQIDPFTYG